MNISHKSLISGLSCEAGSFGHPDSLGSIQAVGVFEVLRASSFLWFVATPFPVLPLEAPKSANQAFVVTALESLELFMELPFIPSGHTHCSQ